MCQITVYDALRVGQYVDQSSSHGLEKLGEDILTSPEVIRAQTLVAIDGQFCHIT